MEPTAASSPFNDPEFLFQVKWDGVRMIAFCLGSEVRLQNRKLHDRTRTYPEVADALCALDLVDTVLDGEIVVVDEDGARFELVMKRDNAAVHRVDGLRLDYPVSYIVFDILYDRGRPVMNKPLSERLALLRDRVPGDEVLSVIADHDQGLSLFSAVVGRKWEGIVAKRRDSMYRVGVRTDEWLKIKRREREKFLVVGFIEKRGRLSALIVGREAEGGVQVLSRVGSGLKDRERRVLLEYLETLGGQEQRVKARSGERAVMVVSNLEVEVEFQSWTADGGLRAPVVKRITARD